MRAALVTRWLVSMKVLTPSSKVLTPSSFTKQRGWSISSSHHRTEVQAPSSAFMNTLGWGHIFFVVAVQLEYSSYHLKVFRLVMNRKETVHFFVFWLERADFCWGVYVCVSVSANISGFLTSLALRLQDICRKKENPGNSSLFLVSGSIFLISLLYTLENLLIFVLCIFFNLDV